MRIDLIVHILAGTVAIITGFVALFVAKGGMAHRKSGMAFVYAMLVMSLMGAGMAAVRGTAPGTNIPAGLLAAYFVMTGLATVSPPPGWSRRVDVGLMLLVSAIGLSNIALGVAALAGVGGLRSWMAIPSFIFGTISLMAAAGDLRMIRSGARKGTARLARHLWRMSFALLVAAFSFFLGQAKVIPKPIRIPALLMIPPLLVLAAMLYWLWRVRFKQSLRGVVLIKSRTIALPDRPADGVASMARAVGGSVR